MKPIIFGFAGPTLTAQEAALFREADPAGFILFGRNVESPAQLRALTDALRDCVGRQELAILIDQEGGRVQRLGPPHWPEHPAAARFGALYAKAPMTAMEAARANAEAMALSLFEAGISVACAPVLDLRHAQTHAAIGDRSFGADPMMVAALGQAVLHGLAAGGVCGVIKHMPGQGRAAGDSHLGLPRVDAKAEALEDDLAPFVALSKAPIGMTSHTCFECWDDEHCATVSPTLIDGIIREKIGFEGLLLSDDIDMEALSGTPAERAAAVVVAGCDIALACQGGVADKAAIAAALGEISDASARRLSNALASITAPKSVDKRASLIAKRDSLLAYSA